MSFLKLPFDHQTFLRELSHRLFLIFFTPLFPLQNLKLPHPNQLTRPRTGIRPAQGAVPVPVVFGADIDEIALKLHDVSDANLFDFIFNLRGGWNQMHISAMRNDLLRRNRRRQMGGVLIPTAALRNL